MTTATGTWTERTVEVAGKKVRLLEGGRGEPLVVLHHSTGNPGWLPFHEQLAASFHVFVPDMPGYGQSERPDWARDARDLAILVSQLVDKLNLDRITLVGTGFGGFVAAELASMNQGRLKALVLIGAAGIQPEQGEILDQMLTDYKDYVEAGFRDETAYHNALGEDPAAHFKELWDFSREMTARLTWKPYMFNRRLPPLLAEVKTPALLIWGAEDRIVPPICGDQYARALGSARLERLHGAGHLVEMEEPERVAELIRSHAAG
ncbi:MAG TPA: alpha/beta fold hydrolase [Dehalococcoidia bacterium]